MSTDDEIQRQYEEINQWALKEAFIKGCLEEDPHFVMVDLPFEPPPRSEANRIRRLMQCLEKMERDHADQVNDKEEPPAPAKGWEPEEIEVARWQYEDSCAQERQEQEVK